MGTSAAGTTGIPCIIDGIVVAIILIIVGIVSVCLGISTSAGITISTIIIIITVPFGTADITDSILVNGSVTTDVGLTAVVPCRRVCVY